MFGLWAFASVATVSVALSTSCDDGSSLTQIKGIKALKQTRRLHFMSMGRSGSCFWGELFGTTAGRPYIFEPFNEGGWGAWKEPQKWHHEERKVMTPDAEVQALQRMDCLYRCEGCETLVSNWPAGAQIIRMCQSSTDAVVIKTVAMFNASSLLHLPRDTLKQTKVVVMLRDPRSMPRQWAGTMENCCTKQLEMALTIKDLVAVIGKEHVRTLFYEHWSRNLREAVEDVANWAGVEVTPDMLKKAQEPHPGDEASAWLQKQPENLQLAANESRCEALFSLVGYPSAADIPSVDGGWLKASEQQLRAALPYDGLRDPSLAPMTLKERQLLEEMPQTKSGAFAFAQLSAQLSPPATMSSQAVE